MSAAAYFLALLLTLAIESPVYAALLRLVDGVRWRDGLRDGAAVNLISHPLAFLVLAPRLIPALGVTAGVLCIEVLVVAGEAALLRLRRSGGFAWLQGMSVVANGLSFAAGLILIR